MISYDELLESLGEYGKMKCRKCGIGKIREIKGVGYVTEHSIVDLEKSTVTCKNCGNLLVRNFESVLQEKINKIKAQL